jgi:uncharacterized protein (DUF302 family)
MSMADYHFTTRMPVPLDLAKQRVLKALQDQGFGVLTEIDVQGTLKKKLGIEFKPYLILGACNPQMAYQALQAEDKIGTMLPCNVVLQQLEDGTTEVSAVDPVASMQAIKNPKLAETAGKVREMLRAVIDQLA